MILEVDNVLEADGESVPTVFKLGSESVVARGAAGRWLANHHSYFKIIANDGGVYILPHDKPARIWELSLFSRHGDGH